MNGLGVVPADQRDDLWQLLAAHDGEQDHHLAVPSFAIDPGDVISRNVHGFDQRACVALGYDPDDKRA
ncbi:MAG: hypothetical protein JRE56_04905 [Deltaproteobacteria bacterium]|nr:hypothetical protein [Deltaproteobacteria bacterium]MDH4007677.1 hypothetical protein [Desulfuromonadales bacterium]